MAVPVYLISRMRNNNIAYAIYQQQRPKWICAVWPRPLLLTYKNNGSLKRRPYHSNLCLCCTYKICFHVERRKISNYSSSSIIDVSYNAYHIDFVGSAVCFLTISLAIDLYPLYTDGSDRSTVTFSDRDNEMAFKSAEISKIRHN